MKQKTIKTLLICVLTIGLLTLCPTTDSNAASVKSQDKAQINTLIKKTTTYVMYQMAYKMRSGQSKKMVLNRRTKEGLVVSQFNGVLTNSQFQAESKNMLGKKLSIKGIKTGFPDPSRNIWVTKRDSNTLCSASGDWGAEQPQLTIKTITKSGKKQYTVKTTLKGIMEFGSNINYGTVTYTIRKNKNLAYGYWISGVRMKRK